MAREYYPLWLRLDGLDRYAIWYSGPGSNDGVVVNDEGLIVSFTDAARLRPYALAQGLVLEDEEPLLHDLDAITPWLMRPRKNTVECQVFLAAWNIIGDIAASTEQFFDPKDVRLKKIASKLFWGNNLPAVTPPGQHYTPIWTKSEVGLMHHTLSQGLCLLRAHLITTET